LSQVWDSQQEQNVGFLVKTVVLRELVKQCVKS
jgi:hypothetical protein